MAAETLIRRPILQAQVMMFGYPDIVDNRDIPTSTICRTCGHPLGEGYRISIANPHKPDDANHYFLCPTCFDRLLLPAIEKIDEYLKSNPYELVIQ